LPHVQHMPSAMPRSTKKPASQRMPVNCTHMLYMCAHASINSSLTTHCRACRRSRSHSSGSAATYRRQAAQSWQLAADQLSASNPGRSCRNSINPRLYMYLSLEPWAKPTQWLHVPALSKQLFQQQAVPGSISDEVHTNLPWCIRA
jgi:hypothetical protein